MFISSYHYIPDTAKSIYDLHGPDRPSFVRHLEALSSKYEILSLKELAGLPRSSRNDDNHCALTFDDGPQDHYEIVPELISRNIPASFFVIASVYDGHVPLTIKMHIVYSKFSSEMIRDQLEEYVRGEHAAVYPDFQIPSEYRVNPQKAPFDDPLTANLKHYLAILPLEIKEDFVNKIFAQIVEDEKQFCRDFFIQPEQLKEMHEQGMTIGSHTYSHMSLQVLSPDKQREEMKKSKDIIEDIIGAPIDEIAYPFGQYNEKTQSIACDIGFSVGVLFNHAPLGYEDPQTALSRYDYRDVPCLNGV